MDTNLVQEEFIPWSAHSDVLPGLETFYNFYMVLIRFKIYTLIYAPDNLDPLYGLVYIARKWVEFPPFEPILYSIYRIKYPGGLNFQYIFA